jgi:hypothetical protein
MAGKPEGTGALALLGLQGPFENHMKDKVPFPPPNVCA